MKNENQSEDIKKSRVRSFRNDFFVILSDYADYLGKEVTDPEDFQLCLTAYNKLQDIIISYDKEEKDIFYLKENLQQVIGEIKPPLYQRLVHRSPLLPLYIQIEWLLGAKQYGLPALMRDENAILREKLRECLRENQRVLASMQSLQSTETIKKIEKERDDAIETEKKTQSELVGLKVQFEEFKNDLKEGKFKEPLNAIEAKYKERVNELEEELKKTEGLSKEVKALTDENKLLKLKIEELNEKNSALVKLSQENNMILAKKDEKIEELQDEIQTLQETAKAAPLAKEEALRKTPNVEKLNNKGSEISSGTVFSRVSADLRKRWY